MNQGAEESTTEVALDQSGRTFMKGQQADKVTGNKATYQYGSHRSKFADSWCSQRLFRFESSPISQTGPGNVWNFGGCRRTQGIGAMLEGTQTLQGRTEVDCDLQKTCGAAVSDNEKDSNAVIRRHCCVAEYIQAKGS